MLDACSLFSFSLEKSLSQSILSQPWTVAAWVRLMWVKLNCPSYPFQCSCSWLFATLGYFYFLIGFWNSHKSMLVHILLSNWLVFLLGNKGGGPPSCWYYLWISSFPTASSKVLPNTYLKLNFYSFPIRTDCNRSCKLKSLGLAATFPTENRASGIKEEEETRLTSKNKWFPL